MLGSMKSGRERAMTRWVLFNLFQFHHGTRQIHLGFVSKRDPNCAQVRWFMPTCAIKFRKHRVRVPQDKADH